MQIAKGVQRNSDLDEARDNAILVPAHADT